MFTKRVYVLTINYEVKGVYKNFKDAQKAEKELIKRSNKSDIIGLTITDVK